MLLHQPLDVPPHLADKSGVDHIAENGIR